MQTTSELAAVRAATAAHQRPIRGRAVWQLLNSFGPLLILYATMYASLALPYWVTLILAVPAAVFVVRIFIIQHDCGHGSFLHSRRANDALGLACSLVTLAPYASWKRQHAGHHANWNNLDRRLSGLDIYSSCLTVEEYQRLPPLKRLAYRFIQHPVVSLLLIPPFVFLLLYRIPFDSPKSWRKERWGVHLTNLGLALLFLALGLAFGFWSVLAVHLPVAVIAAIIGVWLFSLQHRFEETLWARQPDWAFERASLQGSSYLKLPKLFQWCTGNIGFHHVHHLNPRIPNYRLEECHQQVPVLQSVPSMTLWNGLTAITYALWDEGQQKMVRFSSLRRR